MGVGQSFRNKLSRGVHLTLREHCLSELERISNQLLA